MAKKRYYGAGFYQGMDQRRALERMDSNMIHEDQTAMGNMPTEVMIKQFPESNYGGYYNLNDTMSGINVQIKEDSRKKKMKVYAEKF